MEIPGDKTFMWTWIGLVKTEKTIDTNLLQDRCILLLNMPQQSIDITFVTSVDNIATSNINLVL